MLNRNCKSKHIYHTPDHRGKMFSPEPLSMLISCEIFFFTFLSVHLSSSAFYHRKYKILWNSFSVSVEMIMCLSFLLVIVFITLFDFHMLNQHWISSISPTYCDVQSFSYNTGFGLLVFHWGFGGQYSLLLLTSSFHVMSL